MTRFNLNINGQKVHGIKWGDPNKPTLLCLHGLGGSGVTFNELAELLQKEFHIIALDGPGHGGTDAFQHDELYMYSHLTEWIQKVLIALDKKEVYVAGHSWGGNLAVHFAADFPDVTKGVILLDGGYLHAEDVDSSLEAELQQVDEFCRAYRFSSWEAYLKDEKEGSSRWSALVEEAAREKMQEHDHEIVLKVTPKTAEAVTKASYQQPAKLKYQDINASLLLLRSTLPDELEDIRKEAVGRLEKSVGNTTVTDIQKSSHDIYVDAPATVAEQILKWVK